MDGGQVEKACEEEGEGQNDASGYQVTRWATRSRWNFFLERCKSLADCNSPNSLTLILIEGSTQLSIVHVQPQYILHGDLSLKCRNQIVIWICF